MQTPAILKGIYPLSRSLSQLLLFQLLIRHQPRMKMANLFPSVRQPFLAVMTALLLALVTGPRAGARPQSPTASTAPVHSVLTSADIVRELQLAEPPEQIIQQVRRHRSAFTNLDDLFASIRASATPETAVSLQQLTLEIAAAVARGGIPTPTADVASA